MRKIPQIGIYGGLSPENGNNMPLLAKNGTLKSVRQRLIAAQQLREE